MFLGEILARRTNGSNHRDDLRRRLAEACICLHILALQPHLPVTGSEGLRRETMKWSKAGGLISITNTYSGGTLSQQSLTYSISNRNLACIKQQCRGNVVGRLVWFEVRKCPDPSTIVGFCLVSRTYTSRYERARRPKG
jgi:hypothetical protein